MTLFTQTDPNSVHILIPVFNTEIYIEKTIISIINQSSANKITVILLDDGSTDRSMEIAKKILSQQNTIKAYYFKNKSNLGVAVARQRLLTESKEIDPSAYIVWLDSDDYINDESFIEIFLDQMYRTKADILLYNFEFELEDKSQKENLSGLLQEKEKSEKILDTISEQESQVVSPLDIDNILDFTSLGCTKGYSSDVNFPEPIKNCLFEDFVYMAMLLESKNISAMPASYMPVTHLRRKYSITGNRTPESLFDVLKQLKHFYISISLKNRLKYSKQINSFIERKINQYGDRLSSLVKSSDLQFTEKTLEQYNSQSQKLLSLLS